MVSASVSGKGSIEVGEASGMMVSAIDRSLNMGDTRTSGVDSSSPLTRSVDTGEAENEGRGISGSGEEDTERDKEKKVCSRSRSIEDGMTEMGGRIVGRG